MTTPPRLAATLAATLAAFAVFAAAALPATAGDALAPVLSKLAQETLEHCRAEGHTSVGVLPFIVVKQRPGQEVSSEQMQQKLGTIHKLLARRMEVALVLANNDYAPIGVIDDASRVATQIAGAGLFSLAGRERLFSGEYPLRWGDQQVEASLMVTGLVRVEADLRTATVGLLAFSAEEPEFRPLGEDRAVKIDAGLLPEMGESFALTRGAFTGGKIKAGDIGAPSDLPDDLDPGADDASADAALDAKKSTSAHPLNDSEAAVRVRLLINGQPAETKMIDGVAHAPEPQNGDDVAIELTKDSTPSRYAVCVKVNGESTYQRSRQPDANCRRYILSTPGKKLVLRGYQMDDTRLEKFRVLSDSESAGRAFAYGEDVGMISVSVFAEVADSATPPKSKAAASYAAISSAAAPKTKPGSLAGLKAVLMGSYNRGLIAQGGSQSSLVKRVSFKSSRSPVMSVSLRYYKP